MDKLITITERIPDDRQHWKVVHSLKNIVVITLFALLANADDWVDIGYFAKMNKLILEKYLDLSNGVPSHDTIQRVMSCIEPQFLQQLNDAWVEILDKDEGEKIKELLCIDGKTMRGSRGKNTKPLHVVSAWAKERGVCFGQKTVDDKSNEIPAIKELLDTICVKDTIVTIDAIGTQTAIAEKIIEKKGDYVLAVKENQATLYDDIKTFFEGKELLAESSYTKTIEKARGQIEKREYWQNDDVSFLVKEGKWIGLKTIGMSRNTITKDGKETTETRYYISSLPKKVEEFASSVRGHWSVESMHWHLDTTFREDKNQTREKISAENLNILRKLALSMLKTLKFEESLSIKKKRNVLGWSFASNIEKLMSL